MSEEVMRRIKEVTKSLYKMNVVCFVFTGLVWAVSLMYGVTEALKHGISWEVIQIIDGVETVSTRNTFLNMGMSAMFLFMMITVGLSGFHLFLLYKSNEGGFDK